MNDTIIQLKNKAESIGIVFNMKDDELIKYEDKLDSIFWKSNDEVIASNKKESKNDEGLIYICVSGDIQIKYRNESAQLFKKQPSTEYTNSDIEELINILKLNDSLLSENIDKGIIEYVHNNWFSLMKVEKGQDIPIDTASSFDEALLMLENLVIETLSEQDAEDYQEENKGNKETDLRLIKIDETEFWDETLLKEGNIKKVFMVYLFDKNAHTYCAEQTFSYFLKPLYFRVESDNEDGEDFIDRHTNSETWDGGYYNHYDIDAKEEELVKVDNFKYFTESGYSKKMEKAEEECRGEREI